MTIKAQQRLLLLIVGIIFMVMFGLALQSNRVTSQYQGLILVMTGVIKEISDVNLVSGDYLRNHHDRPLIQLERRLVSLNEELAKLKLPQTMDQDIPAEIKQDLSSARKVFAKLKEIHTQVYRDNDLGMEKKVDAYTARSIETLADNLSISALTLATSAHFLMKSLVAAQGEEIRFYDRLRMGGLILSFLLLTFSVYLTSRRLVNSVARVKSGAARIASGDLSSRIEEVGNDELTDLTRSINTMSEKLMKSRQALEDEIAERKQIEESLLASEQELRANEEEVTVLNQSLQSQLLKVQEANKELESFTYSVSHDLRAPLRHLTGFVELLTARDSSALDDKSLHYLQVINAAAKKMGCLIDDLLSFSRMGRGEMTTARVELGQLSREVIVEIAKDLPPERQIDWQIGELPSVVGDRAMLRLALVNLLSNAVKFSAQVLTPIIEIGVLSAENDTYTFYVRDNGVGFDMKYVDKLFGLFQRLHSSEEYEGTGVGLANVRRIIDRHGGRTWAEGELNKGATFYFTLPQEKERPS